MKKVLITGGTGLIGVELTKLLLSNNYQVVHLSRKPSKENLVESFEWNIESNYIDLNAFDNVEYIVHLAGAGIADEKWSSSRKKEIIDSRVKSSQLLYDVISNLDNKPYAIISASGIGWYGAVTDNKIYTEEFQPSNDFLGTTCKKWEDSVNIFSELGLRVVKLRTGVVLSDKGGALPKMMNPVKFGVGSVLGSGKQIMPWISINDICKMYLFAIENRISGAFNAVSGNISNENFTSLLAKKLDRKILLPKTPSFILKLALGEMANLILEGSVVSNEKIKKAGFEFKDTDIEKVVDLFI